MFNILFCFILFCSILFCSMLFYAILYYSIELVQIFCLSRVKSDTGQTCIDQEGSPTLLPLEAFELSSRLQSSFHYKVMS